MWRWGSFAKKFASKNAYFEGIHLMPKRWRSKSVRIGCASGFFGDTSVSARQLVDLGKLDFLVMDYLSETTMSLLVAAQNKNPALGFIPDFVEQARVLADAKKKGIKVVANAGGINPHGCADALKNVFGKKSSEFKIAVVTGDNLMPKFDEIRAEGVTDIDTGAPLPDSTNSMTAYLGAVPIREALNAGADIVITGRCTDSALALGPLMHSHGWAESNLDKLASGSLAGHLIECGAQATGGVFTDWKTVDGWDNIGFPIVECFEDGNFNICKPDGTGGLVNEFTVGEQMLYEVHDPAAYVLPDVTCDFTDVCLKPSEQSDNIQLGKAKGLPPTPNYKVCATYANGYRLTAVCAVGGPQSAAKARKTAEAILARVSGMAVQNGLEPITNYNIQVLGSEQTYGANANPVLEKGIREAVLWMAVHHMDKRVLGVLSKEIAPAGTGMAPGLTAIVGGRPKVSPVFNLFSFLYPKSKVPVEISINGEVIKTYTDDNPYQEAQPSPKPEADKHSVPVNGSSSYTVGELAYTRSGDKGNHANIGVICRNKDHYPILLAHLTEEKVGEYFKHVFPDNKPDVTRFEVPGICAVNFLLRNSLGGGGVASLRSDPQGKAFGQMLLDLKLDGLPENLSS